MLVIAHLAGSVLPVLTVGHSGTEIPGLAALLEDDEIARHMAASCSAWSGEQLRKIETLQLAGDAAQDEAVPTMTPLTAANGRQNSRAILLSSSRPSRAAGLTPIAGAITRVRAINRRRAEVAGVRQSRRATDDKSRNNWLVAVLTGGEG